MAELPVEATGVLFGLTPSLFLTPLPLLPQNAAKYLPHLAGGKDVSL